MGNLGKEKRRIILVPEPGGSSARRNVHAQIRGGENSATR